MIDKALSFLQKELNENLKQKMGSTTDLVTLTTFISQGGELEIDSGTLGMMVVNIEEEKMFRSVAPQTVQVGNNYTMVNPELKLNVYMMIAANHSTHQEALKLISNTILFFQGRNSFSNVESPALDDVEQLTLDLYTINFEQQNQLWASLGAKYMPSVMYRIRMLIMNDKLVRDTAPAVTAFERTFAGGRE
jgi:hypothetical protein